MFAIELCVNQTRPANFKRILIFLFHNKIFLCNREINFLKVDVFTKSVWTPNFKTDSTEKMFVNSQVMSFFPHEINSLILLNTYKFFSDFSYNFEGNTECYYKNI